MSRPDIAVALKRGRALDELRDHPVLKDANEVYEHEQGILFVFRCIKWSKFDREIEDFYCKLEVFEKDHLIVGADFDYDHPNSDEFDAGGWEDNPFELARRVEARLSYCVD